MSDPRTPTTDLGRLAQGTPLTRAPSDPPLAGTLPPPEPMELLEIVPEFAQLTEAYAPRRTVLVAPTQVAAIFGPVDGAVEVVLAGTGRSILVVEGLDEVVAALGAKIRGV